ncbi:peptide/nickel transport system ATP-binding protein [Halovenus aranensis]|uniref:Peptide/nickel transport system ATP-binding protein n=1 Tax=Halovenus aranensis TaxID=890420 RepID=A0A1G8Z0V8_9EURY|nr:ABC transporter ATP-binding protein [Halovenus aranensis]SDK08673.1 peptide/nickel transport system ATP-binding protein [Halovenus aranensis]
MSLADELQSERETSTGPLVEVRDLEKHFFEGDNILDRILGNGPVAIRAVDGVSFDIHKGETLGLVGESGCGKSTTGETVLRLQEPTGGTVRFDGDSILDMAGDDLLSFRRNAQIVFQDPYTSLDPRVPIGETVREALDIHGVGTLEERNDRVRDLLERVGLSEDQFDRYPSEFSGGQRQRIGIARALALNPDFLVLDEPTSALDVSVQAQILNLLSDLQEEFNLTYLLISHDLSVIRHICDRVAVMYLGEIAEVADVDTLFESPKHPYTEALLESVPRAETAERDRDIETLKGDVPSPRNPPSGCRFRTRCPKVIPPAETSIDQQEYREVMHFRELVEDAEISIHKLAEDAGLSGLEDGDQNLNSRETAAFVEEVKGDVLDTDLTGPPERVVDEAIGHLAEADWESAATVLRDEFESICETDNPELSDDSQPVACHLYET